jgi:tRNA A-37 threonylcarbamoyl transferase component Bud32
VVKLLGRGKGGYSYLVTDGDGELVLKQIHHEPCDYYQFTDKLGSELADYAKLREIGLRVPELYEVDTLNERLLKEYIPGDTVQELVEREALEPELLEQIRRISQQCKSAGLNIDYYPTNFVVCSGLLWYIDYECNPYSEEWNFENWGIRYWIKPEMQREEG